MPDSITRRQAADIVVQPAPPGTVAKHTQQQLDEALAVAGISLAEYERAYSLMMAAVEKPGRNPEFQNWYIGKAALVMAGYEVAHDGIIKDAWRAIVQNHPQEIITTIYKDKPFLKRLTGG
jgi:hypothetical protein